MRDGAKKKKKRAGRQNGQRKRGGISAPPRGKRYVDEDPRVTSASKTVAASVRAVTAGDRGEVKRCVERSEAVAQSEA